MLGIASAAGTVFLGAAYAVTLVAGLLSLRAPQQPIGDPWFSILEILILLTMPLMVVLMATVHSWASSKTRIFGLLSLVFMALAAMVTCSVHFVIFTLVHQAAFSGLAPLLLSFQWPSIPYALDILAWDVFFPLSVLFAAPVFSGSRLARSIRALLVVSGALALAGLSGVIWGDMRLRNIGIAGYAAVFPVVAAQVGILFHRATSNEV